METKEIQWRAQVANMRSGLQNLKVAANSHPDEFASCYLEVDFDDSNLTSESSDSDISNYITETEDECWSSVSYKESAGKSDVKDFSPQWLSIRCQELAKVQDGLTSEDFKDQIMALLLSNISEEELQSTLTDIIGFDDMDFVTDIIIHRHDIAEFFQSSKLEAKSCTITGKLLTKSQRLEAIRQADYEHKNAKLGVGLSRDEPQYPHVFKSHSAGNILDSKGQKYGLPIGSELIQTEASFLELVGEKIY